MNAILSSCVSGSDVETDDCIADLVHATASVTDTMLVVSAAQNSIYGPCISEDEQRRDRASFVALFLGKEHRLSPPELGR